MGTYETILAIRGLASAAVFSEDLVPGEGNDYQEVLKLLGQNPTASTNAIASGLVEAFFTGYASNPRPSITRSAVDVVAAEDVIAKTEAFFQLATTNLPGASLAVAQAAFVAQHYGPGPQKDFVNLLDSLRTRLTSAATIAAGDVLRSALVSPAFVFRTRKRNGSAGFWGRSVSRSTGLAITLPSGVGEDAFRAGGPGGLPDYLLNVSSAPWTTFLQTYLASLSALLTVRDLGTDRLQLFEVWNNSAFQQGAEVDMVVLQPNQLGGWDIYSPALGVVTPNGVLTPDSYDTGLPVEGFFANRYVRTGLYYFLAFLFDDPLDRRPLMNVLYRNGTSGSFIPLYASGQEPRLTSQNPFLDDPTPTEAELFGNAYSDLQVVATWDLTPSFAPTVADVVIGTGLGSQPKVRTYSPLNVLRGNAAPLELAQLQTELRRRRGAPQRVPLAAAALEALRVRALPR
jgi:hypothetical protein